MTYTDIRDWRIDDPAPGVDLGSIPRLSDRAKALVIRNPNSEILQNSFINVWGAVEFLSGLDYHFDRFVSIYSSLCSSNEQPSDGLHLRHEAVAYINRAGQFIAFSKSEIVKSRISNLDTAIPSIMKLKVFRDKHTAHRSIDDPRHETENEKYVHARSLSILAGSHFVPRPEIPRSELATLANVNTSAELALFQTKIKQQSYLAFQISSAMGHLNFVLEQDHPNVAREAYSLIETLIL